MKLEEEKKDQFEPDKFDNRTSRRQMIIKALMDLPLQRGTKKDIFNRIERIYELKLHKNSSTYKTLEQSLSKYFTKTPQEYQLYPNADMSRFVLGNNPGMKQMLIFCLMKMKNRKGDIKSIREKMLQLFGDRIRSEFVERVGSNGNLQEWEKTMLKTFSRHSDVFCKTKAVFSLNNNFISTEGNHSQMMELVNGGQQDDTMNSLMIQSVNEQAPLGSMSISSNNGNGSGMNSE